MSLPNVLLGMLSTPASGYDLKQKFSQSVRHFWSAELSQIYPALARLEKHGLLESSTEPSEKGPNRRIYRRTGKGDEALTDWLLGGPVLRNERNSYLTQVFFLAAIPTGEQIAFMTALRADFAEHLQELERVEQHWAGEDPRYPDDLPDEELFPQMTLRLGIMKYATIVAWCDDCLRRLQGRDGATAAHASR